MNRNRKLFPIGSKVTIPATGSDHVWTVIDVDHRFDCRRVESGERASGLYFAGWYTIADLESADSPTAIMADEPARPSGALAIFTVLTALAAIASFIAYLVF